ncbi:Gfo/Idh/MocA family oxidoreductase [Draconibacterium sp. IB214405]|uniref:Gfo/Idh/MocA family protein n=1 Tax=Draconibacterium sp. IB214405 TaxID=3097352 RepID=UPI002A0F515A|nr:Gfo/Idh/MocA family oxidoreductase [Draconibacterium sp. IB214405]MDX8339909.1 Gfo/Idh/MocA family oxidoreductase [Draconibacterium sp. IB214405]
MNKIYNWAVLGCGKIAKKFVNDLKLLPNAKLYAAASRDLSRAQDFANELGFEKAYGNYTEMAEDPNVDVVYIATPHSHHYEHTMLCLKNKKAVLCEKAFAMNAGEVKQMISCAKENNTFLMEAFWTMFQPSFNKALEIVNSGELGKLKMVRSDFAFNAEFNEDKRLYNVKLGGGSLLDIGIYPVFAALSALGVPDLIKTSADFSPTGSEESINVIFKYNGGEMASLSSSFAVHSPIQTEYCCEKGYVVLHPRWFTPTDITIWKEGGDQQIIPNMTKEGAGYQFEAMHVMECLDAGLKESPKMTFEMSLNLIETLDRIRIDAGIFFPDHDKKLFF